MAQAGSIASNKLSAMLKADSGLPARIGALAVAANLDLGSAINAEIISRNVAAELAEKHAGTKYPAVYVYCAKAENTLREKFRRFSGTAELHVEVRLSHDHMDDLEQMVQLYVEAVTDVLDRSRGHWTEGIFYTGGYEITYGPVKKGGRNFLQVAKVRLEVNLSID